MSSDAIITQALESESDSEILQLTLTPPDNIPRQAATALKVASVLLTHLSSDLLRTETDIETNLINMVTPGHPLATQFAAAYHRVKKRDHGREYGAYEELRAAAQSGDVRQGEDDDDEYESPRRRQHGATIAASSSAAASSSTTRKRRSSTLSTTSSRHVRQRTIIGALPSPPLPRALQPAFAKHTSDSESESIDIQRSRAATAAATTSPWSPIRRASSTSPTPTTPSSTDTINMDIVSSPSGSTPVDDPYSPDTCSCPSESSSSPSPDKKTQEEEIPTPPRIGATTTTTTASETIQSTILDDDELESKYDDV